MNRFKHGMIPALAAVLALAGTALAAPDPTAAEQGGSPLLRFDPGVGIWALIVFVLLLLVLKKYAWTPIIDALDARELAVRESLEQAERVKSENARLAEEQAKVLAEARAEAGRIVQAAREAGESLRKGVETAAQEEKRRILAQAQQEIEAQTRSAVAELRKTTAELSVGIAEKLVRQNLDDAKTRALVDQLIRETAPKA